MPRSPHELAGDDGERDPPDSSRVGGHERPAIAQRAEYRTQLAEDKEDERQHDGEPEKQPGRRVRLPGGGENFNDPRTCSICAPSMPRDGALTGSASRIDTERDGDVDLATPRDVVESGEAGEADRQHYGERHDVPGHVQQNHQERRNRCLSHGIVIR